MEIRLGRDSDIEEIIKILKEVIKTNNKYTKWNEDYPTKEIIMEDINSKCLYVMIKESHIVGVVTLNEKCDINYDKVQWSHKKKALVIHRLFISTKESGKGYGKELIKNIIKIAEEKNYRQIRLDTHEDNIVAQGLYEKCGFKAMGKISLEDVEGNFCVYEYNL